MRDNRTDRPLLNSRPAWTAVGLLVLGGLAGAKVRGFVAQCNRLQSVLQEREDRFQIFFRQSPDSMLLIDPNAPGGVWTVVDCNDAACALNGYTREELVGQPINVYLPDPADPKILAEHYERLRRMGSDRRDVLHRRADGTVFPLEASMVLLSFEGRELILGMDRDISQRRRSDLLTEAEETVKARSELLSVVSHELKSPLTIAKGNAQLLRSHAEKYDDVKLHKLVETVERQVDRMSGLVEDVLDLSRIETGNMQFEMLPLELNSAVEEIVDEQASSNSSFAFRLDKPAGSIWVLGDRERIQQVVANLLANAVKYSGQGREVDVRVAREGAHAVVSVTDHGIGIPSEEQAKIFSLYFRASNVTSTRQRGAGIGLYISRRIIDRHSGTIGVQSVLGEGSTFYFRLPIIGEQDS